MFTYKSKEYKSKAEVLRELYNLGVISMTADSKKHIAKELGMTVQTVHATLKKLVGPSEKAVKPVKKTRTKKSASTEIEVAKVVQKFKTYKGMEFPLDEKGRLMINQSPNPFDLPVLEDPIRIEL